MNTTVIGVIFTDIKGFPFGKYNKKGRNLGDIEFCSGGVTRNIVENFANAGEEVSFVTLSENSPFGIDALSHLERLGVKLDYVKTVENNGIGMWLVVLDELGDVAGEISKMPDISALQELLEEKGDEIIRNSDNIIFEMDTNEEISEKVLSLAEKYNKKKYTIVGNMSVILKRRDLVKRTDCFICNEVEMSKLLEENLTYHTPDEMAQRLKTACLTENYPSLVVTMGENGAAYYDKENDICGCCPAECVDLVDSTGAGDAFLSGTVIALSRNYPLSRAVKIGTYMAAMTVGTKSSACPAAVGIFD